jgi:hypothetical protein
MESGEAGTWILGQGVRVHFVQRRTTRAIARLSLQTATELPRAFCTQTAKLFPELTFFSVSTPLSGRPGATIIWQGDHYLQEWSHEKGGLARSCHNDLTVYGPKGDVEDFLRRVVLAEDPLHNPPPEPAQDGPDSSSLKGSPEEPMSFVDSAEDFNCGLDWLPPDGVIQKHFKPYGTNAWARCYVATPQAPPGRFLTCAARLFPGLTFRLKFMDYEGDFAGLAIWQRGEFRYATDRSLIEGVDYLMAPLGEGVSDLLLVTD